MFILVVGLVGFNISITSASNTLNIFAPGGKPYGLSYPEHIQNFWKWLVAIPAVNNPLNDGTGVKCATNQTNTNSSVFYLAPTDSGTGQDRTCKVPVGKGLFIPVMPEEISDKESPGSSVTDLATAAKTDQDRVNSLSLKIDNKEYTFDILTKYRTNTKPFELTFADKGPFGVDQGGNSKAVADGFYIITEPLTKGAHIIQFKSSVAPDENGQGQWSQDVKYNITAE